MGKHRTPEAGAQITAQAIAMRRAGVGVRRIAAQLQVDAAFLHDVLREVPLPASTVHPRAKNDHREAAVLLRSEGRTYAEIQAELGVSKGSLSLWLRDQPRPTEGQREELRHRVDDPDEVAPTDTRGRARLLRTDGWLLREIADELGVSVTTACVWCAELPTPPRATHGRDAEAIKAAGRAYWALERPRRAEERQSEVERARAAVGPLDQHLLTLLAAVAYWCEGSKSKPWMVRERLTFINSDADLVQLWLAWLRRSGVQDDRINVRLSIHASANVTRATAFWASVTGIAVEKFRRPTLKRHAPKTVRHNTGDDYVGCLVVDVARSRELYRLIEGSWRGIVEHVLNVDQSSRIVQRQDNGL